MRLTVHEFMTLDGVVQGPGGADEDTSGGFTRGGWVAPHFDEVVGDVVDGWFAKTAALLFGRTTYDMMAAYWPLVTDPEDAVAARLNAAPKHVVSTTLGPEQATWANTASVFGDDVAARIGALRAHGAGELQVHGSWQLVQTLLAEGLVDELRLIIAPVVVGAGKRLFPGDGQPSGFEVLDSRIAPSGAVALSLVPARFRTATYEVVDGKETQVDDE